MLRIDWSTPLTDAWPEAKAIEAAERLQRIAAQAVESARLSALFKTVSFTGHHGYGEGGIKIVRTNLTLCDQCGALVGSKERHDEWHQKTGNSAYGRDE